MTKQYIYIWLSFISNTNLLKLFSSLFFFFINSRVSFLKHILQQVVPTLRTCKDSPLLKKTKQLPKMPFKVLYALSLNYSFFSFKTFLFLFSPHCSVRHVPSSVTLFRIFNHFQMYFFSLSIFCFPFTNASVRYSHLEIKTFWTLCFWDLLLYLHPHTSLRSLIFYFVCLNQISLSSIHFKVFKERIHILFIFVFVGPSAMCLQMMIEIC